MENTEERFNKNGSTKRGYSKLHYLQYTNTNRRAKSKFTIWGYNFQLACNKCCGKL